MKLSVIIPLYNEETTIEELIEKVQKVDLGDIKKELVIVDDYSNDRTIEIVKNIMKK